MSGSLSSILARDGGQTALIVGGRAFSLSELESRASRWQAALSHGGLQAGQCVASLLPNGLDAVAVFLATAASGFSYFPLNTGSQAAEVAALVERCRIGLLAGAGGASGRPETPARYVAADDLPPAEGGLERVDASRDGGRPFVYLATSGSTGEPRIVQRTADAVDANCRRVAAALGIGRGDRVFSGVPLWHANGFSNGMLMPLASGAETVLMDRFLPRVMLETLVRQKPSVVVGSPFIFRALERVIETGREVAQVRDWISSGAALPGALDERLRQKGIAVRQLYGSSETGTISISSARDRSPGAVGHPLPGVDLRLRDENGRVVAKGRRGEVEIKSDALFSGYLGEVPGRSLDGDGWYPMRDLGRLDEDGGLLLEGRAGGMINVAGVKVDPNEVTRVLESMPAVQQAVVFGAQDATGMETVQAVLQAGPGLDAGAVLEYCRRHLAEYKLPRHIRFVDELPENLMGKRVKNALET